MSVRLQNTTIWLILPFLIVLSSCALKPDAQTMAKQENRRNLVKSEDPAVSIRITALDVARSMLGVAYRYGGSNPNGFDCSGLVQYSFRRAGVALPRTSKDIFRMSDLINPEMIQPGDLVFFRISSKKVSHVGIYAGNRTFIHAPSTGKGVSYASLDSDYWKLRLVGFGRI